jgi:hypothetical protein
MWQFFRRPRAATAVAVTSLAAGLLLADAATFRFGLTRNTVGRSVTVANVQNFDTTEVALESTTVGSEVQLAAIQGTMLDVSLDGVTAHAISIRDVVLDLFDSLVIKSVAADSLDVERVTAAYFRTLLVSEVVCKDSVDIDALGCVENVWMSNVAAPELVILGKPMQSLTWCDGAARRILAWVCV